MARFRDHRVFSECMWHRRALRLQCLAKNAPVAQLDRALDYESRGQEFESLRARHFAIFHDAVRFRRHRPCEHCRIFPASRVQKLCPPRG